MNKASIFYIEGQNCDIPGIKVTIKSLKEHFSGKLIVLHKNVNAELILFLSMQSVSCVDCSNFKVLFNTSPYNNKIIYTYLYLKENITNLQHHTIMFCDISDVYFKTDPFSLYNNKLTVFSEDLTFGECNTNKTWSEVCYSKDVTTKLKDKLVINSGIILASFNDLMKCFKLMLHEMSIILARYNYPTTDQIILNKIIYIDNQLDCNIDYDNVNNMAQGIKIKADNKINHQYKVIPEIKKLLYSYYD